MKTPAAVLEDLMKQVRETFYAKLPPRSWFTQQERVKAALTLPAKWLDERKVELPAERYEAILRGILATICAHGRRDVGAYPCAYLWSCVEAHLRHHGDKYYEEGKSVRNAADRALAIVEKTKRGADGTVPILAQVHQAVTAGRRKSKSKAVAGPVQPDFFGTQDGVQIAKVREETSLTTPNCEKSPARPRRQNPAS